MKHFNEIMEELKANAAEISTAEAEETKLHLAWMNVDDYEEKLEKFHALEEKIAAISAHVVDLKIARELMKNNACVALFHDALPVVLEVLQKYNGKPYGEKTEKKIADEIQEKTGARAYIRSRYGTDEISIYPIGVCGGNDFNITCGPRPNADREKQEHLLNGNKINALPFESFTLWYIHNDYIEDIPAAVEELKRLRALAVEKQNELGKICGAYNAIARAGLSPIYKDKAIYERFAL